MKVLWSMSKNDLSEKHTQLLNTYKIKLSSQVKLIKVFHN